jgi:N-acetylglutamate synthase-like GNAT family acetyltransferase
MPSQLRAGTVQDAASIRALLESAGLPTEDLLTSTPLFVVACDNDRIIATGALQRFGRSALLRSVVVAADLRRSGLGRTIVQDLERLAQSTRTEQLFLLTQTAQHFFELHGYRVIDRQSVPHDVQASAEFSSLCPASATCMAKALTERG